MLISVAVSAKISLRYHCDNPENYHFLLSTNIFIESKLKQNQFNFEKNFTDGNSMDRSQSAQVRCIAVQ